ncbi:transposase [Komagataeibacter medellinensis NBRC 3288]|uniref:Transposase n=1 Tax=Komagataeibacter medellinensis (strain NBRC 3288 / BCRC 11682 / LMG 1693 / Kondo 51) TaxID=634177 RepID=G2I7B1_KOMMN|nr:transposase [Komagataeibacter medellinensis NBRC 3288]
MHPFSEANEPDGFGERDEIVPRVTGGSDDMIEDGVGQPVGAEELPDVFDRVQFGSTRWQEDQADIARQSEFGGRMPWRAIRQNDGMGFPGYTARNPVEMQVHTVRSEVCGLVAPCGTDYPEKPGVGMALVSGLAWPGSPSGSLPDDTVLLPDPRFVLESDFNLFAARQMAGVELQDCREVFLKASMTDRSCPGWQGRALT